MKKISVVLPTYNERDNLAKTITEIFTQEKALPGYKIEIVVADSGSPDGTGDIAKELASKNRNIHFIAVERGIGVGLIKGHLYSLEKLKPDILVQMDADGQVDAEVLPRLVGAIEDGYDLVLGSRFIQGGKNELSFSRKLFTSGSSWFCRLTMGPWNIKEFTNSARAFTPALFKKINLQRLPWREKTFINQPAFLNEAVLAGAKYKEVPLIFKNRAEGYSKNKVVNYIYDIVTYGIDARLHRWGIKAPIYYATRRGKTLIKFGLVGFIGTVVDFVFYNLFINLLALGPATAKGFSTEIAIINNFLLNNTWTFKYRKTTTSIWQKLIMFNAVSFGGLFISVAIVKFLHILYGDGFVNMLGLNVPYYNVYFFATIPPVMLWNFTANHLITWRSKVD